MAHQELLERREASRIGPAAELQAVEEAIGAVVHEAVVGADAVGPVVRSSVPVLGVASVDVPHLVGAAVVASATSY